ncbi:3-oxoacyl-ACP reductase FabG [Streptomyces gibsoniae]|uniref:3-oxoacyl-ACP reductase FabG n=1 Tax=Streptomyces gibsoniae TaxID=3075529 RepID=A0ABU2U1U1_9ACTN|nr:3-oxoacyl-ACP reductase FabG [Streptomyces sp. DSM 41699]MDT0467192.1 3-oxoacyl-ACP reductase FabG [Streptomyces sp. DSM 41699]
MHNAPRRTAVVTGAGRGIGAAIAIQLAADGMAVALLDLDKEGAERVATAVRASGGRALALGVDVSERGQVDDAVARVADELGTPTVLVNNAGVIRDNLLFKMTDHDWDTVMSVHLTGTFLMTRAVQRYMTQERRGRIVNVSSTSALGNRGQANYAAAKAGLQGFTKTVAIELGPFGVTANAVAPGYIDTDMLAVTADRVGMSYKDFKAHLVKDVPVNRMGTPQDIANAVSFLAGEGAGFVSGQVLYIAGGPKN